MKLTTGILLLGMVAGAAWAQNPDIIENTRNTTKAVVQKKAIDTNAALSASQGQGAKPSAPASKPAPASPAKTAATHASGAATVKPAAQPKTKTPSSAGAGTSKPAPAAQPAHKTTKVAVAAHATAGAKTPSKPAAGKATAKPAKSEEQVAVADKKNPEVKKETAKPISLTGRRDPFVSPVVARSMVGSGCSTGKKCLAVDQINLKGVVRAEAGMIAVVTNAMNKAYFLRENDPVFNGYVVKITGDSIIFKETIPDKLGKPFTREVTKRIITPAV
jgi:Tfp pilus assembly protein PilP